MGGFLGGFLIASITGLPKHKYYLSRTILAGATILVLLVGLFNRGAAITKQTDYTLYNRAMIAYYYQTDQLEKAEQSYKPIMSKSCVEVHTYKNMKHSICSQEEDDITTFLESCINKK